MSDKLRLSFTELIKVESVRGFIELMYKEIDSNPGCSEIELSISTGGGDVDIAIELYNFLRALPCRLTTINTSYVNSAGIIIYLAGEKRVCRPEASFYVHSVSKKLNGEYDAASLKRELEEINANTGKITGLLERKSKKPGSYWRRMMNKGVIILPDKALQLGLATHIN